MTAAALFCLLPATNAFAGDRQSSFFEAGDPLEYNVPYVAWAGEEVRLVKCVTGGSLSWDAEWAIVDSSVRQRSGDLRDPVFFDDADRRTGAFAGSGEQAGRVCWAIDIESVHPGMTRVQMALDGALIPQTGPIGGNVPGSPQLKHDFLVIWLDMGAPTLTELAQNAFPGLEPLGAPAGGSPADYIPADYDEDGTNELGRGLVRVSVTGSFVDLHGTTRTLPADWASLAGRYAYDTDDRNPMAWDIHDDQSLREGHTNLSMCVEGGQTIDAVDNCLGGGEVGRFSRTVGGTHSALSPFVDTMGPFDPVRPGSSYLPDGKLDAGDAPMPAARIDLRLAGNVGGLEAADKHDIYSRDGSGDPDAHNLYAPFYVALIPADASNLFGRAYTTSGTHGAISNNFPGYQTHPGGDIGLGIYHYWDLLNARNTRRDTNVCYDIGQFPGSEGRIPGPDGYDRATVYTDEHGEAMVWFNPAVGANVPAGPGDANIAQGLCDLGEGTDPELLGTATITAEARDPFKPTFNDPRNSNALVKNVFELASKSLDCVAKTSIEAFCVETITDIFGNPVQGARVEFSREPLGLLVGAQIQFGGFDTRGSWCSDQIQGLFQNIQCTTNNLGQAGVIVKSTLPGLVDVLAENVDSRNGANGILRDRCIRFSGGAALPVDGPDCQSVSGTTPPPTTGGNTGGGNTGGGNTGGGNTGGGSVASATTVVSLGGAPAAAAKPEAKQAAKPAAKAPAVKKAAVKSAKLRLIKGKLRLIVDVKGGVAKKAKVRIRLVYRTGRVVNIVRTVKVGKAAQVPNLVVSKHVKSVRVSLAS